MMQVLLDTCALIWLCSDPERFSERAKSMLLQENVELFVSDASVFEISVKHAIGKLTLPEPPREWIDEQCRIWGIRSFPMSRDILYTSAELPMHHRDPFDRLIIGTVLKHQLPVITSDRIFSQYGVELIW